MARAAQWWLIESNDGYRSTAFQTRAEARFRLREMAAEPYYAPEHSVVRQSDDMIGLQDGTTFRVVKV